MSNPESPNQPNQEPVYPSAAAALRSLLLALTPRNRLPMIRVGIVVVCILVAGIFGSVLALVLTSPITPVEQAQTIQLPTSTVAMPLPPTDTPSTLPQSAAMQLDATFKGSGNTTTSDFSTGGNWTLVWSCDPSANGGQYPLPYNISVTDLTGLSLAPYATPILNVTCDPSGAISGSVSVPIAGLQSLQVQTGYPGQDGATTNLALTPWTLIVEEPQP